MGLLSFLSSKRLSDVLTQTFKVKVQGVKFEVRKINPLDYLDGSKSVIQTSDTYKVGKDPTADAIMNINKVKDHYADVFMASVVTPKLTRDKEQKDGIYVYHLLTDWELASELYAKIIELSYGKKKLKSLISQKKS